MYFSAFIANFNAADPAADANHDGDNTPDDCSARIAAFNPGIASGTSVSR